MTSILTINRDGDVITIFIDGDPVIMMDEPAMEALLAGLESYMPRMLEA